MPPSPTEIAAVYEALLGRPPSPVEAEEAARAASLAALGDALVGRGEFLARATAAAARHFVTGPRLGLAPGDLELLEANTVAADAAPAEEGVARDMLGVRTRIALFGGEAWWSAVPPRPPLPGDFHAEAAEWAAFLKALEPARARGRLRAAELGAGHGPWTAAAYAWARRAGIADLRLHAVEADPGLFDRLRRHLAENGVPPEAAVLHHAAVGVEDGEAAWPDRRGRGGEEVPDHGARPLEGGAAEDYRGQRFATTLRVPMVGLSGLLRWEEEWDLVHMDLQGLEGRLCAAALPALRERARHLLLATHSKALDAACFRLFHAAGWECLNDLAPLVRQPPGGTAAASEEAMTWQDGLQLWRNPALAGG